MRLRIWGCRGSVATPGPSTVRYGGNTSCVEVRASDDTLLVLDAGTGIRPLGVELAAVGLREIHVMLSHLHLDHLQGLGFFQPLFDPNVHVHLWGPPSPISPLEDRIARYLSPPLFPVGLKEIPATVTFHDAPIEPIEIGAATVVAAAVEHQGPTVGYRITDGDSSLAYLPDHEPSLGVRLSGLESSWISGFDLAHGVDVLLHDAQYGDSEYPTHVGWGHSAIDHVVEFAKRADVGRLVLFHHDPYHDDDQLDVMRAEATALFGETPDRVVMAYEGMELTLA